MLRLWPHLDGPTGPGWRSQPLGGAQPVRRVERVPMGALATVNEVTVLLRALAGQTAYFGGIPVPNPAAAEALCREWVAIAGRLRFMPVGDFARGEKTPRAEARGAISQAEPPF